MNWTELFERISPVDDVLRYFVPDVADASATLFEHCALALDQTLGPFGAHGKALCGCRRCLFRHATRGTRRMDVVHGLGSMDVPCGHRRVNRAAQARALRAACMAWLHGSLAPRQVALRDRREQSSSCLLRGGQYERGRRAARSRRNGISTGGRRRKPSCVRDAGSAAGLAAKARRSNLTTRRTDCPSSWPVFAWS